MSRNKIIDLTNSPPLPPSSFNSSRIEILDLSSDTLPLSSTIKQEDTNKAYFIPYDSIPKNEIDRAIEQYDEDHLNLHQFQIDPTLNVDDPTSQKQPLDTGRQNGIFSSRFIYAADIPEYPDTSENGTAYVISTKGMKREEVENLHRTIQYNKALEGTKKTITSNFLNCNTTRRYYKCSGVRHCTHLRPDLWNNSHTSVDLSKLDRNQNEIGSQILDPTARIQQGAQLEFQLQNEKYQKNGCKPLGSCRGGKPKLRTRTLTNGGIDRFVGCSNYQRHDGTSHYFSRIYRTDIDLSILERYLNDDFRDAQQFCNTILTPTQRQATCRSLHIGSIRSIIDRPCTVKFYTYIPNDLDQTPWMILSSHGTHLHPPPPPSKTSHQIIQDLTAVVQRHETINLTAASFLRSPELRNFLNDRGVIDITSLHPTFANMSLISILIRKQQLLDYPLGRDFAGVVHEFETRHQGDDATIQSIQANAYGLCVVCFSNDQAKEFLKTQHFLMDMTYQRIHGEVNEFVFAVWDETANIGFQLARVYTSDDSFHSYYLAFTSLFRDLEKVLKQPIQWQHIHHKGIYAITTDMCGKQAHAFGQYLSEIDPSKKWDEHIQYVMIYCRIHLMRGIELKFKNHRYYDLMRRIPNCSSKTELELILNQLLEDPITRAWAIHKSRAWIISGLHIDYSRMDREAFLSFVKDSNLGEVTHRKTNYGGIGQSFLGAIKSAQDLDNRDLNRVHIARSSAISLSYKDNSPYGRLKRNAHRSDIRSRSRSTHSNPSSSKELSTPSSLKPSTNKQASSFTGFKPISSFTDLEDISSTGLTRESKKPKRPRSIATQKNQVVEDELTQQERALALKERTLAYEERLLEYQKRKKQEDSLL